MPAKKQSAPPPKNGGLIQQAISAMGDAPASKPFSLSDYMRQAEEAIKSSLLPAGQHSLVINEAIPATQPSANGLEWTRLICGFPDHPDADSIPMFLPLGLDQSALVDDGNGGMAFDPDVLEPSAVRAFVAGLKKFSRLLEIAGIDPAKIESASDADLLIGTRFEAIITVGKDRDGIPTNGIARIIGPAAEAA